MNTLPTDNLKYCQDALALRTTIEDDFLLFGEYLYNIKEHRLYEPQWSSFLEYSFELKMSQNTINKLIQIHKVFVLEYGFTRDRIKTAGVSLLSDVLPAINSKKEAQEWLEKAELLTRQDLRRELVEHRTGISMAKCRHKDYYLLKICCDCHVRMREYEKEKPKKLQAKSKGKHKK